MKGVLDSVDLRTQLAGKNRFEMLLFQLNGKQRYGINVFKVREVLQCMHLTQIPERHPAICGIAKIREKTVPVIDLSLSIQKRANSNMEKSYIIVTEYNGSIQGFLVANVQKIINLQWDKICPPPPGLNGKNGSYLTAVTNVDDEIIEILDVEKILQEISPSHLEINADLIPEKLSENKDKIIVVIDDSSVARSQVVKTLKQIGVTIVQFKNGKNAIETLRNWADTKDPRLKLIKMVICDIEMPEMDGYTFTIAIREREELKHLFIILHTSLSGSFNETLVAQVGANMFISKFDPNKLARIVMKQFE